MACAIGPYTSGKGSFYRLQQSRGRQTKDGGGKSMLTERWYFDTTWSPSTIERKKQQALADFERRCEAGEVLSNKEKKAAAEAAEAEAQRLAKIEAQKATFEKYSQLWLNGKKITCTAGTVRHYGTVLRLHILPVLGDFPIDAITAGQVRQLLLDILASGMDCGYVYLVLKGVFEAAEMDDAVSNNIMHKVKMPRLNKDAVKEKPKRLTAPQLAALLDAVESRPLIQKALVYVLSDSGCRVGECLALQWSDIDWATGSMTIDATRDRRTQELHATKTAESNRTVKIGPDTLEALRAWQIEQAKTWGVLLDVFTGRKGQPLHQNTVLQWLHSLGDEIGAPWLHPHALRHTAATLAIENGADISGVSRRLGHANVSITLGVYTNPTDQAADRAGQLSRDAVNQARAQKLASSV